MMGVEDWCVCLHSYYCQFTLVRALVQCQIADVI